MAGCEFRIPDFQRPLPNGYVLIDTSSGVVSITDPQCGVLIGPTVDLLGIRAHTVVGRFTPDPTTRSRGTAGYFILDTRSGTLEQGLMRDDWARRLGPGPPPGLYEPVRLETDRSDDLCRPSARIDERR